MVNIFLYSPYHKFVVYSKREKRKEQKGKEKEEKTEGYQRLKDSVNENSGTFFSKHLIYE